MNTVNLLEDNNPLNRIQPAEVASIDDPTKQGRIKVNCPAVFDDLEPQYQPWIYPIGYNAGVKLFNVPDVGSKVFLIFMGGDIYSGFYFGGFYTESQKKVFDEDYPNTYGFQDDYGNYLTINKITKEVKFHHSTGTEIQISSTGAVKVKSDAYVTIDAPDVATTGNLRAGTGKTGYIADQAGKVYGFEDGILVQLPE